MAQMAINKAIEWIADNDEPGSPDALEAWAVAGLVTVQLIADLSGHDTYQIARRVVEVRENSEDQPPLYDDAIT